MKEQLEIHATLEDFQGVSQKLRLTCRKCRDRADYDVGAICCDQGKKENLAGQLYIRQLFSMSQMRRPGPWEIMDRWKVLPSARASWAGSPKNSNCPMRHV